jgi:pyridoxine 4-dehydrogenase
VSAIQFGDLTVNRLGFGAMRVIDNDNIWGEPSDRKHAHKVLRRAAELGVNFFDTAESYGPHTSETLIGEALHPYPKGFVVATKCGLVRPKPGRWDSDARPEKLRKDLAGSLKRLKLERIDLYQLHAVDPEVPLEVSVGTLADMQREGKVRHVGLSNVTVKELEAARKIVPIVSVQNRYNVTDRKWEDEVAYCEREGLAFIPWFPLSAGAVDHPVIHSVAARHGATVFQIALAWLLEHSPAMLVIPGTSSVEHLEENVAAAEIRLSKKDLKELEEIAPKP